MSEPEGPDDSGVSVTMGAVAVPFEWERRGNAIWYRFPEPLDMPLPLIIGLPPIEYEA